MATPDADGIYRGRLLRGLRDARAAAALSLTEVHAATGVSKDGISQLETLKRGAYPRTVRKLAKALGVTPAALYRAPTHEHEEG